MLLVALSLLMCYSRVQAVILYPSLFNLSIVIPMSLPGTYLINSFFVAKKAACGPPYPMGTPNL